MQIDSTLINEAGHGVGDRINKVPLRVTAYTSSLDVKSTAATSLVGAVNVAISFKLRSNTLTILLLITPTIRLLFLLIAILVKFDISLIFDFI